MELRYSGLSARRLHLRDGRTLKVARGDTVTVTDDDGQSLLRQGGWDEVTEPPSEPTPEYNAAPDQVEPVVEDDGSNEESEEH